MMKTNLRRTTAAAALALAIAFAACGGGDADPTPTASRSAVTVTPVVAASTSATLQGTLTFDGAPLAAQFLGVRVVRDGLAAACQDSIPSVLQGSYEIAVAADATVRGCGAPGAELILWTYAGGQFVYSTRTTPWPGNGAVASFDAEFSSANPAGASKPVTEFKGTLTGADGRALPTGTVVQAYVGDVLCGVTSLRPVESSDGYFSMAVAGPESVPGCTLGGTITFKLDGRPAKETTINDLAPSDHREVDLTLAP